MTSFPFSPVVFLAVITSELVCKVAIPQVKICSESNEGTTKFHRSLRLPAVHELQDMVSLTLRMRV